MSEQLTNKAKRKRHEALINNLRHWKVEHIAELAGVKPARIYALQSEMRKRGALADAPTFRRPELEVPESGDGWYDDPAIVIKRLMDHDAKIVQEEQEYVDRVMRGEA